MLSSSLLTVTMLACGYPCCGYGYPPGGYYVYPPSPYNPVYHGPRVIVPELPLPVPERPKTLYDRLGGDQAIRAVVDDLVARAAADPKVNFTRKGTPKEWKPTPENVEHVKKMLVELIASATGGPQKYTGKSMKDVHAGMKITHAEFDALAADLKATLDKFKVPAREQDELMKIVAATAPDIVEPAKK
jgi:hemoglobin